MKVLVGNIQRFCLDDGPGIRTTVFFKGCSLRCPWCCNPENLVHKILIGKDNTIYGKEMSSDEIFSEIIKDKIFYQNNGGVTFSGGECLLTLINLEDLLIDLKKENINICVETSLFVNKENLQKIYKYIDEFYVDIKIIDSNNCLKYLKGDVSLFLNNFDFLCDNVDINKIHPRIPIVKGITDKKENIDMIINLLKNNKIHNIEIFSVHNLAKEKYSNLDMKFTGFEKSDDDSLNIIKNLFEKDDIMVKILKF